MKSILMSKVHTIFPKTVYESEHVLVEELDKLSTFCSTQFEYSKTPLLNVPSTHRVNDELHLYEETKPLVEAICLHTIKYCSHLGYTTKDISDLKVVNMWTNVSSKGDYIFPHVHSDSFISGVYYVECDDDEITFFNNPNEIMDRRPSNRNEYNYDYHKFSCNPGKLLLFKSNMLHGTHAQSSNRKIAISFNIR